MVRNNLHEIRARRGVPAAELARRVGVSRQTIYAIEDGTFVPNTTVSLQLSRALQVTVEEIFSLSDEETTDSISADLLSTAPVREEQPVQLCRVNRRLVAVPAFVLPAYLPQSDAVVESQTKLSVQIKPSAALPQEGTRILIAGCDPALALLHDALQRFGTEIIAVPVASRRALGWLKRGRVHAAGTHLVDRATGEYNIPIIRQTFSRSAVKVITFATWEQGLVIRRGNPKSIRSVADLAGNRLIIVNREKGSGSRDLLESSLRKFGIPFQDVAGYDRVAPGHLAAAYEVKSANADCCVATRSAARCFGLDFVPLAVERFDLTFTKASFDLHATRVLMDTLQHSQFRRKLESIAGYDTAHTGEVLM